MFICILYHYSAQTVGTRLCQWTTIFYWLYKYVIALNTVFAKHKLHTRTQMNIKFGMCNIGFHTIRYTLLTASGKCYALVCKQNQAIIGLSNGNFPNTAWVYFYWQEAWEIMLRLIKNAIFSKHSLFVIYTHPRSFKMFNIAKIFKLFGLFLVVWTGGVYLCFAMNHNMFQSILRP